MTLLTPSENAALDQIALQIDEPTGDQVMRHVHKFLGRFIAFPGKHEHVAVSLWVLHCHLMDRWESTPRLAFLSAEPMSGKTRALEILDLLVPDSVQAVNVSPAYLFRRVAKGSVTLLFDEIDTVFGPKARENEDIRAFLNAGHRKGAVAGRCVVRGKTVELEELEAFCAVAVAGLGWLPDTILTRSVVIRMRRRHAGETIEGYRRRQHAPQGGRIRQELIRWAAAQPKAITDWPKLPPEIQDRAADVWEPLIVVADLIGGDWPRRAREAAVALVAAAREGEPSLGVRLLADTQTVFREDVLSSKALLGRLLEIDESPWSDIKGKALDQRGLAYRLRQYSIKSKTVRIGNTTIKGYAKADFLDAWERYLPPSPDKSVTSVTSVTNEVSRPSLPPDKSVTRVTSGTTELFQPDSVADALADEDQRPQHDTDVMLDVAKNASKFNDVSDVADVTLVTGEAPKCAQCNSGDPNGLRKIDGVFLHKECVRFFRRDPPTEIMGHPN